eukprot:TRINITY_DN3148_c0_g1_i3.p1 TRINITY_DN3148_c0_g1~~TRINITY_DN3148_c0_g1_i3.p1  ORF type:complete len:593 (-),score=122.11 TRINITY_DN3148_c0_g1_i3:1967-3745(-)
MAEANVKLSLQIFSGVAFSAACGLLIALNSKPIAEVLNSSYPRRLQACTSIVTQVMQFSALFNFFQLTTLDDVVIPGGSNYALDMSRPVEWICTCPLMQLCLVVLGGNKIPQMRTLLMPGLALLLLVLGVISTLTDNNIARAVIYCISLGVFVFQVTMNRKQILEVSDGREGLLSGTSPFRTASLCLILTWIPFPLWYLLSPEGLNLVKDGWIIEVGWVVLNITAKFSFSFLIQNTRMQHDKKAAEVALQFQSVTTSKTTKSVAQEAKARDAVDLKTLVKDTLSLLALSSREAVLLDRFKNCYITNCSDLDKLDFEMCRDKALPWEIIYALQQRLAALNMNMDMGKNDGNREKQRSLLEAARGIDVRAFKAAADAARSAGVEPELVNLAEERFEEKVAFAKAKEQLSESELLRDVLRSKEKTQLEKALKLTESLELHNTAKRFQAELRELSKKGQDASMLLANGLKHLKNNAEDEALSAFNKGLKLAPSDTALLLQRAEIHHRRSDWEAVVADTRRVLSQHPQQMRAALLAAEALRRLQRVEEALAVVNEAARAEVEKQQLLDLRADLEGKDCDVALKGKYCGVADHVNFEI